MLLLNVLAFFFFRIVVLAGDTLPIEVYCHLPVMCEDKNLPYAYIPSKVVSERMCDDVVWVTACGISDLRNMHAFHQLLPLMYF